MVNMLKFTCSFSSMGIVGRIITTLEVLELEVEEVIFGEEVGLK